MAALSVTFTSFDRIRELQNVDSRIYETVESEGTKFCEKFSTKGTPCQIATVKNMKTRALVAIEENDEWIYKILTRAVEKLRPNGSFPWKIIPLRDKFIFHDTIPKEQCSKTAILETRRRSKNVYAMFVHFKETENVCDLIDV